MFFSETLLPEPSQSEQRPSNNWSESSSSTKFNKSRRNKHPRKKQRTNSQDYTDLLVFGYEAKTFRDNEMSQKVNKGELLIPWRGENENKILLDRVKAYFYDTIRPEDVEQEKLCDEERWVDLDSEFEDLYSMSEEERDSYIENKRKRKKMQEEDRLYSYDYSDENLPYEEEETILVTKPDYAPKFSAPNGMITPSDNRIDEIIERTAKFINSSTDPQMEIIIQAKQSNNPSFSFLNKDDPLYPYYKHVRLLLQTGLFAYGGNDDGEDSSSNEENGENENDSANGRSEGNKSTDDFTEDEKKIKLEGTKVETFKSNANSSTHNTASRPSRPPQPFGPVVVPPPDLKVIIDKMSAYVAKNGQSLEAKVREKHIDDPRFSFLLPWNEFHPYYKHKIQEERATIEPIEKETAGDDDATGEE
ncbi:splicing factor, suppressor of white-apricot homolog isoform X1 [Rhizophagus irregularis DAOM 181602=DAOM 197198]|nr:splicing factor, suppressor of white-apricot homolog isoform X1 [Rhizophagus irregularis DAOM 181602=DAOM 197198]